MTFMFGYEFQVLNIHTQTVLLARIQPIKESQEKNLNLAPAAAFSHELLWSNSSALACGLDPLHRRSGVVFYSIQFNFTYRAPKHYTCLMALYRVFIPTGYN